MEILILNWNSSGSSFEDGELGGYRYADEMGNENMRYESIQKVVTITGILELDYMGLSFIYDL